MSKPRVDLDIALSAIDTDLDAMGEEIATLAGQVSQVTTNQSALTTEVREVGAKIDHLFDYLRQNVVPQLDKLGELGELRRRIVSLEDRSPKHPLDAE